MDGYTLDFEDVADSEYTAEEIGRLHLDRHKRQIEIWVDWLFRREPRRWVDWVIDENLRRVGLL